MSALNRNPAISVLAVVTTAALAGAGGDAYAFELARQVDGIRLQVDNDLFVGQAQDRDYTGGIALTLSGDQAREAPLSLDALLGFVDAQVTRRPGQNHTLVALQAGVMAFTPTNISAAKALHDDRPYASLMFVANSRVSPAANGRTAWYSSLTVGALGLSLTNQLHDIVHHTVGSEPPRGYDHQISAGGEPTARYAFARLNLWGTNLADSFEVKTTLQSSVGYLTEASAAVSMRFGRLATPWWSWAPELTDYMAAPLPTAREAHRPETHFFGGLRLKARVYNVFLQGQFRESEVRYGSADLEPFLAEAWLGLATDVLNATQVVYSFNYQSAEIKHGPASRETLWAAVQITRRF